MLYRSLTSANRAYAPRRLLGFRSVSVARRHHHDARPPGLSAQFGHAGPISIPTTTCFQQNPPSARHTRPTTFAPSFLRHHRPSSTSTTTTNNRDNLFDLTDKVILVTGGGQGLGLCLAAGVREAGAHVYCLDIHREPQEEWRVKNEELEGRFGKAKGLGYATCDVRDAEGVERVVKGIAEGHGRLDGLIAAAGVQHVTPALSYPPAEIPHMLSINYTGVHHSATSSARAMIRHRTPGSLVLIGSMSAFIANKGFTSSVYNSSKAAVVQLARSLAMEWGRIVPVGEGEEGKGEEGEGEDGKKKMRPIRVNALCPGNILTPMVRKNFQDDPALEALWTRENMLGRMSLPEEYVGAALFLLSERASSFMTGGALVVDGGYTAW